MHLCRCALVPLCLPLYPCVPWCLQGAGKGKALEFILKELKEVGAYPEAGVQVRPRGGGAARAAPWEKQQELAQLNVG